MIQVAELPIVTFKIPTDEKIVTATSTIPWLRTLVNEDDDWDISQGRFEDIQELNLFNFAQKINIRALKIRWTQRPEIIKSIRCLKLPNLKELFLNGNAIDSIEILERIDAPCLQNLNLKENNIHTITQLKKFASPQVTTVALYKNFINEFDSLSESNCPQIETIWISGRIQIGNNPDNTVWVAKLPSKKLTACYIHQQRGIQNSQEAFEKKINQRHHKQIATKYKLKDDYHISWL